MKPPVRIIARTGPLSADQGLRKECCVLDLSAPTSAAVQTVTAALQLHPARWFVVRGPAADPFLRAVWADLALPIAGAIFVTPESWPGAPALEAWPLSFPSMIIPGTDRTVMAAAKAWGAVPIAASSSRRVLTNSVVRDIIDTRTKAILRGTYPHPTASKGQPPRAPF